MIFPEGCSTNGKYICDFKKGAFAGLRPVKPICYKYWSWRGIINDGSGMNVWWYSILLFHCIVTGVVLNELPVFAPNDYFWENHWDGKEDKWKTYANVVRQIIAEVGNLELHNATMEDKMELKKWLKQEKYNKTKGDIKEEQKPEGAVPGEPKPEGSKSAVENQERQKIE